MAAVGYITYLLEKMHKGKLKTVTEILNKLSLDGQQASGAFARAFSHSYLPFETKSFGF
jgi:hypothetical protein